MTTELKCYYILWVGDEIDNARLVCIYFLIARSLTAFTKTLLSHLAKGHCSQLHINLHVNFPPAPFEQIIAVIHIICLSSPIENA